MKRIFTQRTTHAVQAAFRIVVGFLFARHGAASLFGILGGAHGRRARRSPFGEWPSWWAAVIQLVGGTLVALGLTTRVAALACSGSMAYAYFVVHQSDALLPIQNDREAAALYIWLFLLITALGPGSIALDTLNPEPPSPRSYPGHCKVSAQRTEACERVSLLHHRTDPDPQAGSITEPCPRASQSPGTVVR